MLSNKIAHLFLIHIANTLDDTQLTKKKLLHEALKVVDDLIGEKFYQTFIISSLLPLAKDQQVRNTSLTPEDLAIMDTLSDFTSSKKDSAVRANELFKIAQKPLEMFFEEKLQYYLQDIREQPVLRALCQAICFCKSHFGLISPVI